MALEMGSARTQANWTPLPVPWAVQAPDRIPKQRYYDPDFYALEAELFWPRVWQMACRLEEIPKAGDFVEYEIVDQSIIVVRLDAVPTVTTMGKSPVSTVEGKVKSI